MIGKFGKIIQIAWETIIKWIFISLLFAFESSCARMDLNNPSRVGDNSFLAMQGLRCVFKQDSVFCPATGTGTATGTATGTVSDTTPPTVASISPVDSTTGVSVTNSISVTFSESMSTSTLTAQSADGACSGSFQVSADSFSTCIGGTLTTSGNPTFTFSANPNLCVGNSYKVKITTGAKDLAGNALTSDSTSTGFSTQNPTVGTGANNEIYSIAKYCNTLYVGGSFTTLGGQTRNSIGSIDLLTGSTTSWNPGTDSAVYAIALSGTTLFVGGNFTIAGGSARSKLASFDITTGSLNGWNPVITGSQINTIVPDNSIIYVGGLFSTVGATTRNNIAAIDMNGIGNATSWYPTGGTTGAFPDVNVIEFSGSNIYIGGRFSTIGGQAVQYLAVADKSTGVVNGSWYPASGGTLTMVNSLAISSTGSIYVGGQFTIFSAACTRVLLAEVNDSTGVCNSSFTANMSGTYLKTLVLNSTSLYLGGFFTNSGGSIRNNLSVLSTSTGVDLGWIPDPGNYVDKILISGNVIYVSGIFGTAFGQSRLRIAAFDLATGSLLP